MLHNEASEQSERFLAIRLVRNVLDRCDGKHVHPTLVPQLYNAFRSSSMGQTADAALAQVKLLELLLRKHPPSFDKQELAATIAMLARLCYYGSQAQVTSSAAPVDRLSGQAVTEIPQAPAVRLEGGLAGRLQKQRSTSSIVSTASKSRTGPSAQ